MKRSIVPIAACSCTTAVSYTHLDVYKRQAKERLIWIAKRAGITLSCRGYFRVDLREKDGRLYVIDVNPNPDLNVDSGLANQSRRSGLSYEALVSYLVEIALKENLYEPAKQAIYEVPEYSAI